MSLVWLFSAAVLTQAPYGFLDRPEVRDFVGPPRMAEELVVRMPRGFVVGVRPQWDKPAAYFVLDAKGSLDTATTKKLDACLVQPQNPTHLSLIPLVGGRGVAVGSTACLVDGTEVLPVTDLWGPGWIRLQDQRPITLDDDAIDAFRNSAEYRALVSSPPPLAQTVTLPNSPYDVVQVSSHRIDRRLGVPVTKLFVIGHDEGPIHHELTAELARLIRSELVGTCGGPPLSIATTAEGILISTEVAGEGEEGSRSCAVLARWEAGKLAVTHETVFPERRHELALERRSVADRLYAAGDLAGAIDTWESLINQLGDTPERSAICRDLARAYERVENDAQARTTLEQCAGLNTNRGETLLALADFHFRHHETVEALARFEEALQNPLGEPDRIAAQAAVIRIELELAEAAAQAGQKTAARLHYQHLLQTPLAEPQSARVQRQLRRLE